MVQRRGRRGAFCTNATVRRNGRDRKIQKTPPQAFVEFEKDDLCYFDYLAVTPDMLQDPAGWAQQHGCRLVLRQSTSDDDSDVVLLGYTSKGGEHGGGGARCWQSGSKVERCQSFGQGDTTVIVELPFQPGKYPVGRQLHTRKDYACPCCFQAHGHMYELKGLRIRCKNSLKKGKGMRRHYQRQNALWS